MESVTTTAVVLLPSAPIVLVYLIGIIMAWTRASLYRRASMLAITGFLALLVGAMVRAGTTLMTLPPYRGNLPIAELATRLAAINLFSTLLSVTGTVLVLLAIFADREHKQI